MPKEEIDNEIMPHSAPARESKTQFDPVSTRDKDPMHPESASYISSTYYLQLLAEKEREIRHLQTKIQQCVKSERIANAILDQPISGQMSGRRQSGTSV